MIHPNIEYLFNFKVEFQIRGQMTIIQNEIRETFSCFRLGGEIALLAQLKN